MTRSLGALGVSLALGILVAGCGFFDGGDSADSGPGTLGNFGDACAGPEQCRAGLVCDPMALLCQASGTGPEGSTCALSGDCLEGLYCAGDRTCSTAGGGVEDSTCASTASCEAGLICVLDAFFGFCRPSGEGDLGTACASDDGCLAGLSCLAGVASSPAVCSDPPALPSGTVRPPTLPLWTGGECVQDEGPATAYFEVPRGTMEDGDFYRLPYPNDVRRDATGIDLTGHASPETAVEVDIIGRYLAASEEDLDGFSTNAVALFRFSRPYDWDTVGGALRIVDVEPGSPTFGNMLGLGWLTTFGQLSKYVCEDWLGIRTGHGSPLLPGHRYAVIVTTQLQPTADSGGGTFARGADLDALLADAAPSDTALTDAHASYQPLRDYLTDADDLTAAEVLTATVFTTQDFTGVVPSLRDAARAEAAPAVSDLTVCDDGVTSPCDDGGAQRACVAADASFVEVHGRIELPIFQQGTAPYWLPEDGGNIDRAADGTPSIARREGVCFALTVPTGAAMPMEGWPVALYLHGTGGSFRSGIGNGVAANLATATTPTATLAIDLPQHGARRGDSLLGSDVLFFNFANPRAARDNILQGTADIFSLVHFVEGGGIAMADSPTSEAIAFDPTKVVVFAHSQGATHAALAIPFENGVLASVLSGAGGDLTQSLLTKSSPIDIAAVLPFALLDPDGGGRLSGGDFHPALAIFQGFFDSVDPVNYGRYLASAPIETATGSHVFMTYGLGDTFTTEQTLKAYALSARLMAVEPLLTDPFGLATIAAPLSGNVMIADAPFTVGMRQYTPPAGVDGHFVSTQSTEGSADTLRFLTEALGGAVPNIGTAP